MRRGRPEDAAAIHGLIGVYSPDGTLLPRSLEDIQAQIGQFVVAEASGQLRGCGALYPYPSGLVEIRSVAVAPGCQQRGVGTALVRRLLREAERSNSQRIFLFTRIPEFFARLGFARVLAASLPEKIWKDCQVCPRFSCCDEIPMVYRASAEIRVQASAQTGGETPGRLAVRSDAAPLSPLRVLPG